MYEAIFGGGGLLDNWFNTELKIILSVAGGLGAAVVSYFRSRKSKRAFTMKDVVMLLVIVVFLLALIWGIGWIGD